MPNPFAEKSSEESPKKASKKKPPKKSGKKALKDKLTAAFKKMESEEYEGGTEHPSDCPCGKCG